MMKMLRVTAIASAVCFLGQPILGAQVSARAAPGTTVFLKPGFKPDNQNTCIITRNPRYIGMDLGNPDYYPKCGAEGRVRKNCDGNLSYVEWNDVKRSSAFTIYVNNNYLHSGEPILKKGTVVYNKKSVDGLILKGTLISNYLGFRNEKVAVNQRRAIQRQSTTGEYTKSWTELSVAEWNYDDIIPKDTDPILKGCDKTLENCRRTCKGRCKKNIVFYMGDTIKAETGGLRAKAGYKGQVMYDYFPIAGTKVAVRFFFGDRFDGTAQLVDYDDLFNSWTRLPSKDVVKKTNVVCAKLNRRTNQPIKGVMIEKCWWPRTTVLVKWEGAEDSEREDPEDLFFRP